MSSVVDTLVEMGFDRQKAEVAASRSGSTDLSVVMDWLLSHEEELDVAVQQQPQPEQQQQPPQQQPAQEIVESVEDLEDKPTPVSSAPAPVAKSIKCEECGKLFKNQEEVEFHASKSGHENFAESVEEKKPLTDEEKKEKLAQIEAKLRQRRLDREAREKEEALQKEKNRIKSGKELLEAKKRHEEIEMKKLVEQRKREKEEERLARQRVREQIEQDKLARKAKFEGVNAAQQQSKPQPQPQNVSGSPKPAPTEVKLQIRLTDGKTLLQTFGAKEPLSAVKVFIELNAGDYLEPFSVMTSHPKKIFDGDDWDKPLDSLGLAPSATLFVKKL